MYHARLTGTRSFHACSHSLQRYVVSTVSGFPTSAAIFFLPLKRYLSLPHSGHFLVPASIRDTLSLSLPALTNDEHMAVRIGHLELLAAIFLRDDRRHVRHVGLHCVPNRLSVCSANVHIPSASRLRRGP